MTSIRPVLLAFVALLAAVLGEVDVVELKDKKAALMAAKTKGDVIVVLLVSDAGDPSETTFTNVCAKIPKGAAACFVSSATDVHERYLGRNHGVVLPTLVAVSAIAETGNKKRSGKTTTLFHERINDHASKATDATAVGAFIFRATMATVEQIPGSQDPDAVARQQFANLASWPKIFVFQSAKTARAHSENRNVPDWVLSAARKYRGPAGISITWLAYVIVPPGEAPTATTTLITVDSHGSEGSVLTAFMSGDDADDVWSALQGGKINAMLIDQQGTHHAFTKLTVAMDIHQNSQTGTFKKTQGEDETRTAIAAMIAAAGDVEQRTLFTEKPASKSNAEGKRGKKKKVKGKQKQAEEEKKKKKKKKKNKKKKSKGKPGKDEL